MKYVIIYVVLGAVYYIFLWNIVHTGKLHDEKQQETFENPWSIIFIVILWLGLFLFVTFPNMIKKYTS